MNATLEQFRQPGIYVLTFEDDIVYVGASKCSMIGRIADHAEEKRIEFDDFYCFPDYTSSLFKIETLLIFWLMPKYNRAGNFSNDGEDYGIRSSYNKLKSIKWLPEWILKKIKRKIVGSIEQRQKQQVHPDDIMGQRLAKLNARQIYELTGKKQKLRRG
jgi:hypothetical protein